MLHMIGINGGGLLLPYVPQRTKKIKQFKYDRD